MSPPPPLPIHLLPEIPTSYSLHDLHIFKYLDPTRYFVLRNYKFARRENDLRRLHQRHLDCVPEVSPRVKGEIRAGQWEPPRRNWWCDDEWREEGLRKLERRKMGAKM